MPSIQSDHLLFLSSKYTTVYHAPRGFRESTRGLREAHWLTGTHPVPSWNTVGFHQIVQARNIYIYILHIVIYSLYMFIYVYVERKKCPKSNEILMEYLQTNFKGC